MSRPAMPWFKLFSRVHRDIDLTGMSLEQQAVYFRLMAYSNEQEERGTFSAGNLGKLARHVANGREDVLTAAIDYMLNEWETIELIDGETQTYRFRTWAEHQRPKSDLPEETAKRKREQRTREAVTDESQNGHAGVTLPYKKTEEEVRDRSTSSAVEGGLGGETNAADESEEHRIAAILEEEPAPLKLKGICRTVEQWPHADMEALAIDYMLWQLSLEPKKRHRNKIQGWQNAVARKHDWPQFQRKPRLSVVPNERLPLPCEPVDCPEVPVWGKLVNHLYGHFQAHHGNAPAEHPRAWSIFSCRPLPAHSTSSVLTLETHEPPEVAAELAKDVKWWLAGACLGGIRVEVTSRRAS